MTTARVFKSGNSQAVRLPKEFRFAATQVEIFRCGEEVVLLERRKDASSLFDLLVELPGDALPDRRIDTPPQERERL